MSEIVAAVLLFIGAVFILLAGVGVVRMPDIFMRLQTATKAPTLGLVCILIAVAMLDGDPAVATRCTLIAAFVFLTGPISAHVIAKAAVDRVEFWDRTITNELHRDVEVAEAAERGEL